MTAGRENTVADWIKPWPINRPPSGHVAPFGIACILLLSGILLTADSNVALVHFLDWRSRSQLQSELERALAVARASMVELPADTETAAVAQLASKIQMVSLETQQVATMLNALQANYDELKRKRKTEFTELKRSVNWVQSQVRWLQEQQEMPETQTKKAIAKHAVDTDAGYNVYYRERIDSKNDETAQSSVTIAAALIADGLRETREEALLSREERLFILDLDKKVFKSTATSHPMPLGSDLNLSVFIAKSETIDDTSGGIRFFPDGSSTGGRIDLDRHGEGAAVVVEWSTGRVDVMKASADPHVVWVRGISTPSALMRIHEPADVR